VASVRGRVVVEASVIHLGLGGEEKRERISERVRSGDVDRVVVVYPRRHPLDLEFSVPVEYVEWDDVIRYVFFYRLLQEITPRTLLVLNEPLRSAERSCLHYNCLRNYLTRTEQQIVFSRFPALESPEDFMILVDLDTRSRWRRSRLSDLGEQLRVEAADVAPTMFRIDVVTDAKTRAQYEAEKRRIIDNIGAKDPHTIPRQLHLVGGKQKADVARAHGGLWVGRNARLKVPGFATYEQALEPRQVLEFCHSFRDWADYLTASGATEVTSLVSDLKVDAWYFERAQRWSEMQHDAHAAIRHHVGS